MALGDEYLGWLEVERSSTNSFRDIRKTFLRWFTMYGVPTEIATDGGPPFNSHDYKDFCHRGISGGLIFSVQGSFIYRKFDAENISPLGQYRLRKNFNFFISFLSWKISTNDCLFFLYKLLKQPYIFYQLY